MKYPFTPQSASVLFGSHQQLPSLCRTAASLALLFGTFSALAQTPPTPPVGQLPGVIVTDSTKGLLEEQPVGPYDQPEWTTARRFPSTRVYLQQLPWEAGFEQWVRGRYFRDGTAETRFQEEIEIGLPYRFQLDLYETWAVDQNRRANQDEYSAELRYALADWGKIPLNPTLYLEYAEHNHAPNTLEGKLLLGTDLAPRWHWGLNFAIEQELSGTSNTELAVSQGISYTLIDNKLSAGLEMEFSHEKANGTAAEVSFVIGPSMQWRPLSWLHLDLAPLIGCTHDSPRVEAYVVLGIDFDTKKKHEQYAPTSLRSH